jgi:small subunit ribosomal protein S16
LIKIRLQRKGRIRRPIYHIVVADSRSPRDGRIIEQVGRYDGVTEKKETTINEERISYWLDNGAKPTDAVEKILRHEGFLYKRHLQMWGKSEEEITAALEEWKSARESKAQTEVTRKEQVRATLIAEEKEVKKQIEQKASVAAAEMAQEAEKAAETAETAEVTENDGSDASAPEVEAETEVTTEETLDEQAAPELGEVVTEETAAPETTDEETSEESTQAVSEEVEATTTEEALPAEQPKETSAETEEQSVKSSVDMTAKEAADHIAATSLESLDGFVTDSEDRKTVLAAWEAKKEA